LLGWLNECRAAVFIIILWMWTSRQSKLTINFFVPSVGKWFHFSLKNFWKWLFSHKTFTCEKTVSLTCWAGLMSDGTLFSSLVCDCGLQGNQNWLQIFLHPRGKVVWLLFENRQKWRFSRKTFTCEKNGKFDLLGWLNECRGPFLIVLALMWTSKAMKIPYFLLFNIFVKVFPSVSLFFKTELIEVRDCATMASGSSTGVDFWFVTTSARQY